MKRCIVFLATIAMVLSPAADSATAPFVTLNVRGVAPPLDLACSGAGHCTLETRLQQRKTSRFVLTHQRLADLKAALRSARWLTLKRSYVSPAPPGSDVSSSSVTYAGRTVTVGSGAHVPRRLARVLHVLALTVRAHV